MKLHFVIILLTGVCGVIHAQSGTTDRQLPETLIRENRIELPFNAQSRTISLLTRAQLKAMPVQTITEALQSVSGLDIRQRGPYGMQADLHIRGGGFDQALVLLNGVRLNDPQTGHHLLNLPIDWQAVEQIEVLKGPGARIFGQNAFAGAVNIITAAPAVRKLSVGFTGGDFRYQNAQLYAAIPIKNMRQHLALSAAKSDGYRYNTDFKTANAFYQAQWKALGGDWDVVADYNQRQFGANGFYGRLEFKDQYEEIQTNLISVGYRRIAKNWVIKPRVFWRRNYDHYVFVRTNPAAFQNFHLSQVLSAELNTQWNNVLGVTGIGVNSDYTALYSNRLGQRTRTTQNAFVEHRFSAFRGRLDITPGIAFSYFSDFGAFAYPGIDVGFKLSQRWKVYANAGETWRVPTYTDLYYEDAGNKGNPDLKPERALSSEIGIKYLQPGLQLNAAVFQRVSTNSIDWTKAVETDKWVTQNFNHITVRGVDVSSEIYFPAFYAGNPWLTRITLGYTGLDADLNVKVAFSKYTLNHLRHQITAGLEHRLTRRLHHNVRMRLCERYQISDSKAFYSVVDNKIFYTGKRLTLFAEATNLLNAQYGEIRYAETQTLYMPGRWFRLGAQVRLL